MKLSFNVPDDLYESYVLKFGVAGSYARMRKILEEMRAVDPSDRYILVAGDARRAIEAVFETTIEDAKTLAKYVGRLNSVKLSDTARIDFNVEELERLHQQAAFHGRTYETFVTEMAAEIKLRMLEQI